MKTMKQSVNVSEEDKAIAEDILNAGVLNSFKEGQWFHRQALAAWVTYFYGVRKAGNHSTGHKDSAVFTVLEQMGKIETKLAKCKEYYGDNHTRREWRVVA
jgi:hypothetical protein